MAKIKQGRTSRQRMESLYGMVKFQKTWELLRRTRFVEMERGNKRRTDRVCRSDVSGCGRRRRRRLLQSGVVVVKV